MTHIMLDIETWGKTPGSDIRSIGAVVFDPLDGMVFSKSGAGADPFYIATDNPLGIWRNGEFWQVESLGFATNRRKYLELTREPETVKWWREQSAEAQGAFANPVELREALTQFALWLFNVSGSPDTDGHAFESIRIWANDPHFDVSILDAVYRAVYLPVPWHYRSPRSMKTVCDLAGITREDMTAFNHGTAHNALDDAIAQALIVCEGYKRLGLQK